MTLNQNNKFIKYMIIFVFSFLLCYFILIDDSSNITFSALIENHMEVDKNSELIYYLNVSYDGIDKDGIDSQNGTISNINSDVIYVEDKIPEGLIFKGFVTTSNGSIGAYDKVTDSACLGKVVDDTNEESPTKGQWNNDNSEYTYHGLHYNADTRLVSFKIDNLQAGCVLTVGIKTMTPSEIDDPKTDVLENRMDFYNFATAREEWLNIQSNTTHAYIGSENAILHSVNYKYEGTVPSNAPELPSEIKYAENSQVGVINDINVAGYTFTGWVTSDVSVNNGKFTMPNTDVTFSGSFEKINEETIKKYKVMYKIEGDIPLVYELPETKEYQENEMIEKDILSKGDIIDGYMFEGWETSDVEVSQNGEFKMPNQDVTFLGKFSEIKYKIEYKFYETNLPQNSEVLLPESIYVKPGETVELSSVNEEPKGYKFLGWYHEEQFEMPSENIVIYGEWKKMLGTFEPIIKQEIVSEDKKYNSGEEIKYKLTIYNNSDFEIVDIMLKKYLDDAIFESDLITNESKNIVKIEKIPASSSIEIYMSYIVKESDVKEIVNQVEILSAKSANEYELEEKEYISVIKTPLVKETVNTPITNKNALPYMLVGVMIILVGIGLIIYAKKHQK